MAVAVACVLSGAASAQMSLTDVSDGYAWGNVPIGGGGFFINVLPHPTRPGVLYVNSDMTGPFIRQAPDEPFVNTSYDDYDMVAGDYPIKAVSDIAISAERPDTVFVSVRGPGLMRSSDAGRNFETVHEVVSFTKHNGPEIAIDPKNPDIVWRGTDDDGLFRSEKNGDAGTWEKVTVSTDAPADATHLVLIPPVGPAVDGRSALVYVGIPSVGMHVSRDGGKTFTLIGEESEGAAASATSPGTVTLLQEALEADAKGDPRGWQLLQPWMRGAAKIEADSERRWLTVAQSAKFMQRVVDLPSNVRQLTLSLDAKTTGLVKGEKPHETAVASIEFVMADGSAKRAHWKTALFLQPEQTQWTALSTTVDVPDGAAKAAVRVGTQAKAGAGHFSSIRLTGETDGTVAKVRMNPLAIKQMACGPDGTVYVCGEDLVSYHPDRGFSVLTPKDVPGHGRVSTLAVHPRHRGHLLVTAGQMEGHVTPLYRSRDNGASWEGPFYARDQRVSRMSYSGKPDWAFYWPAAGPSSLTFDPHQDGRAWISDAYMVWQCEDVWADELQWTPQWHGLEDTVPISLSVSPRPDGRQTELMAVFADIRGLRWTDAHRQPDQRLGEEDKLRFSDACSIATSEQNPLRWYMALNGHWTGPSAIARSDDGGVRWRMIENPIPEESNHGGAKIAVSSTNPDVLVYAPGRKLQPRVSHDGGKSWQVVEGIEMLSTAQRNFSFDEYIAADTVEGDVFYAYRATDGAFLISRDGGLTWNKTAAKLPIRTGREGQNRYPVQLVAKPGVAGTIMLSISNDGLFRSTDYGETFTPVDGFVGGTTCGVGYGAPAPGSREPTLYVMNFVSRDGHRAVFRSDDEGTTWQKISGPVVGTSHALSFVPSRQVFGRVYFGTNGRGVLMGEPKSDAP